jgi:hypothetical protein
MQHVLTTQRIYFACMERKPSIQTLYRVQQKITYLPSMYEFAFEFLCLANGNWAPVIGQQLRGVPLVLE